MEVSATSSSNTPPAGPWRFTMASILRSTLGTSAPRPNPGRGRLLLHKLDLPVRWRFYPATGLRAPHGLPQRIYRRFVRPALRTTVPHDPAMSSTTFFSMPPTSVLVGYFQSLRFFAPAADRIREEIRLDKIATPDALHFGETLRGGAYCAIQIRRGDYVGNPFFDVIDWATYLPAAMNRMAEHVADMQFVVFSDDAAWCREHPLLRKAIIHSPSASAAGDAMYLMSLCSHHIISNSSYGWWVAYLANPVGQGQVIAPAQWFRGHSTLGWDLRSAGWHLL